MANVTSLVPVAFRFAVPTLALLPAVMPLTVTPPPAFNVSVVAVKLIRAGSYAGPEELKRFRVEAEAVARLQHPNIVQVYAVGEQNGLPFTVRFPCGVLRGIRCGGLRISA